MDSHISPDGRVMACLVCGRDFYQKNYDGTIDWSGHICCPITLGNYTGTWEPFNVNGTEYRWACKIPESNPKGK